VKPVPEKKIAITPKAIQKNQKRNERRKAARRVKSMLAAGGVREPTHVDGEEKTGEGEGQSAEELKGESGNGVSNLD